MLDKPITIDQQLEAVLKDDSISNEKKKLFQKKVNEHNELLMKIKNEKTKSEGNQKEGTISALATSYSGSLAVPYFKQETSYWCGPATTKQTVHFFNGYSSSQSTIATAIGTTTAGSVLSDMVKYVNSQQSTINYLIITAPSEELIQSIARYTITGNEPAIARLKIVKGGSWIYSSAGHYMNVTGYSNYGSSVRVTDPYIGWINPSSNGSYYVTSNELYTATITHFAQQISY